MFLIVGKVARELLNDFEWTSLLIEFLSLCEVYMLLDSLDRSLITTDFKNEIRYLKMQ